MPPLRIAPRLLNLSRSISTTSALRTAVARGEPSTSPSATAAQKPPHIPSPIPLVPDVPTFLKVIGRGLSQHASKFPSWEALFSLTSPQLKEIGIEPPRTRRYLLKWLADFRNGRYGIGGDFKHVQDGAAELRVLEVPQGPLKTDRVVVNVPLGKPLDTVPREELVKVNGYGHIGSRTVYGPFARPAPRGDGARVTVTEGMWEDKRGRKVDGGERRRAEIRFKRRIAERRALREAQGFI